MQAVTDAATELSGAQFGAFFYNKKDRAGESYMLYTISGVPRDAFASFPMPRNTEVFEQTFKGSVSSAAPTSGRTRATVTTRRTTACRRGTCRCAVISRYR